MSGLIKVTVSRRRKLIVFLAVHVWRSSVLVQCPALTITSRSNIGDNYVSFNFNFPWTLVAVWSSSWLDISSLTPSHGEYSVLFERTSGGRFLIYGAPSHTARKLKKHALLKSYHRHKFLTMSIKTCFTPALFGNSVLQQYINWNWPLLKSDKNSLSGL